MTVFAAVIARVDCPTHDGRLLRLGPEGLMCHPTPLPMIGNPRAGLGVLGSIKMVQLDDGYIIASGELAAHTDTDGQIARLRAGETRLAANVTAGPNGQQPGDVRQSRTWRAQRARVGVAQEGGVTVLTNWWVRGATVVETAAWDLPPVLIGEPR